MKDTDVGGIILALLLVFGVVALIVSVIFYRRREADGRRFIRVIERLDVRLDRIELAMKALPEMMAEAYSRLEERHGDADHK